MLESISNVCSSIRQKCPIGGRFSVYADYGTLNKKICMASLCGAILLCKIVTGFVVDLSWHLSRLLWYFLCMTYQQQLSNNENRAVFGYSRTKLCWFSQNTDDNWLFMLIASTILKLTFYNGAYGTCQNKVYEAL